MPRSKIGPGRPARVPTGITAIELGAAVDQFLSMIARELGCDPNSQTVTSKRVILRNLTEMFGVDHPTWQLTNVDLVDVILRIKDGASPKEAAERIATGRRARTGRRSVGSIEQARTTLRQFIELCHNRSWLSSDIRVSKPIIRTIPGRMYRLKSGPPYWTSPEVSMRECG
jgi:hypothetical protein